MEDEELILYNRYCLIRLIYIDICRRAGRFQRRAAAISKTHLARQTNIIRYTLEHNEKHDHPYVGSLMHKNPRVTEDQVDDRIHETKDA